MKNLVYSLAVLAVMGLVGCGGGSAGGVSDAPGAVVNAPVVENTVVESGVGAAQASLTTPVTPLALSSNLGTPPSLPGY